MPSDSATVDREPVRHRFPERPGHRSCRLPDTTGTTPFQILCCTWHGRDVPLWGAPISWYVRQTSHALDVVMQNVSRLPGRSVCSSSREGQGATCPGGSRPTSDAPESARPGPVQDGVRIGLLCSGALLGPRLVRGNPSPEPMIYGQHGAAQFGLSAGPRSARHPATSRSGPLLLDLSEGLERCSWHARRRRHDR